MKSRLFISFLLLVLLLNCARRGRPEGGPRDFDKPIMVRAEPEFLSLQFDDNEIEIYFDEYVKLKDVNSQLIVSPPLKYPPIISPQGTPSKKITIKLNDTLLDNTTYTFNFGQSILDNTEGNILDNFKYIISTGDYIDSLKIGGKISDAFNLEMIQGPTVMLYPVDTSYTDSIIYKEKPTYVGSTVDSVRWSITNIKAGTYKVIALNDRSKNYKYNPKEDKIAFYEGTIELPGDSIYDLKLFKETTDFDLVGRPKEVSKGHLILGFEGDSKGTELEVLSETPESFKSFFHKDQEKDTIHFYMRDYDKDTIQMLVLNKKLKDTVKITVNDEDIDSMRIGFSHFGLIHPRDTFKILSNVPVMEFDTTKVHLTDKDSVKVPYDFEFAEERQRIFLNFEQKVQESYLLMIDPGALTDIYGIANDSLNVKFKTGRVSDYCSIYLTLNNIKRFPIIVDLINDRGMVVGKAKADGPREFEFKNLQPSRFMVRVIYDDNDNGKWDTGTYLKSIQPEEVYYFENIIDAKANWEVVESFTLRP